MGILDFCSEIKGHANCIPRDHCVLILSKYVMWIKVNLCGGFEYLCIHDLLVILGKTPIKSHELNKIEYYHGDFFCILVFFTTRVEITDRCGFPSQGKGIIRSKQKSYLLPKDIFYWSWFTQLHFLKVTRAVHRACPVMPDNSFYMSCCQPAAWAYWAELPQAV